MNTLKYTVNDFLGFFLGTPACFVLDSSWTSLKLTTTVDGEEECTDVSAMSPVKIQFLLQYWSKQVQDALMKREIELNLEKSNWE